MSSKLPTFVKGFHDESQLLPLCYSKLGNTDMVVSNYGLGGAGFGTKCHYGTSTADDAKAIVSKALKAGVNYIDTSPWYGTTESERQLGLALQDVPRKAFYISTKVCNYGWNIKPLQQQYDYSSASLTKSLDESLARLKLSYVDAVFIHEFDWVYSLRQIVDHTLPALQKLKAAGKLRYIGISFYHLEVAKKLLKQVDRGVIDVVLTYNKCYLVDQGLLDYLPFFEERGIGVVNASPAGSGLLSRNKIPEWHLAPPLLRKAAIEATEYCHERGVNIASLSAKWCFNHSKLPTTLTSANSLAILEMGLEAATNALTAEDEALIKTIDKKFFDPLPVWSWENRDTNRYWQTMTENGWEQNRG